MTRLYILGAGTPTPTAHRFGSSYVVEVGGEHLMFDCGPGRGVMTLVLSHIGPPLAAHGPLENGIGDVRRVFSGEIVFAEELMSFEV